MITIQKKQHSGFTLLEMLLVITIFSSMLIMATRFTTQNSERFRREKTIMQIQQILNAATTYYEFYGKWPITTIATSGDSTGDLSLLSAASFVPANMKNPYGFGYTIIARNPQNLFLVRATANTAINAQAIANQLPNATVTTNTVTVSTTLPTQVLNNARSVNYAAIYSSGACVPAPVCATPGMKPAIYVIPASVNGVYDPPSCSGADGNPTSCSNTVVQPVDAYTAFARGDASGNPTLAPTYPLDCSVTSTPSTKSCASIGSDPVGTLYWRVCLTVTAKSGRITPSNGNSSGESYPQNHGLLMGSVMAITRCVPGDAQTPVKAKDFPSGTPINIWTSNNANNP